MNKVCAKCGYQRTGLEDVPDWQCPSCNVAYSKVEPESAPNPVSTPEQLSTKPQIEVSSFDSEEEIRKKFSRPTKKPQPKPLESEIILDELHPSNAPVNRQWLGLVGSSMLAIGVFAPLISVPVMGTVNYFANGIGDGVVVFVLSLAAMYMVYQQSYEKIWYPIIGSILVMIVTAIHYYLEVREQIKPLRDASIDMDLSVLIQVQWGFGLMLIGLSFLIMCALREN